MATARREEIERTLTERVGRRVAGRGIPARAVSSAVARVLDALPPSALDTPPPSGAPDPSGATILVAITARSVPDLGSRLRAALLREGLEAGIIGLAASGSHHVATFRIAATARDTTARVAASLGWAMTIVAEDLP